MLGIMYIATAEITWTEDDDILTLTGSDSAIAIIHKINIGQSSDAGDIEAEMLPIAISRYTTEGSGGSGIVEAGLMPGSPTPKLSVKVKDTTNSSGLTKLHADTWNVMAGWLYRPPPDERIIVPAESSEGIVVRVGVDPDDDLTLSVGIVWEEIITT